MNSQAAEGLFIASPHPAKLWPEPCPRIPLGCILLLPGFSLFWLQVLARMQGFPPGTPPACPPALVSSHLQYVAVQLPSGGSAVRYVQCQLQITDCIPPTRGQLSPGMSILQLQPALTPTCNLRSSYQHAVHEHQVQKYLCCSRCCLSCPPEALGQNCFRGPKMLCVAVTGSGLLASMHERGATNQKPQQANSTGKARGELHSGHC